MTATATLPPAIARQFERHRAELPGGPDVLEQRSRALSRFADLGFPSRKLEQWRYTDIGALRDADFEFVPARPDADVVARAAERVAAIGIGEAALRLVFVDGHLVTELSELAPVPGLEARPIVSATATVDDASGEVRADHALAALNAAFASQGIVLRLAERAEIERPIHLVFVGSERRAAPQIRVVVEAQAFARARVIQQFVDLDEAAPGWLNLVTDVRLAAESRISLYRLQEHGAGRYQTALLRALVGRQASLVTGSVEAGGALVRSDYDIALAEPGAEADLFGIALASAGQHVDNHVAVDHRSAHTRSRETFRSIVGERGRAVFNGKIVVREDAQKIDARQRSDNLLLSERAEVDTRPELEIYADDVKCSHGATVGEIDEDHLFYLRSRGLDEETARGLLAFAFANAILERLELPEIEAHVARRIAGQLPETFEQERFE